MNLRAELLSDSGQFIEAVNYRGKTDVPEPDICVFFSLKVIGDRVVNN
jgi:hypothetical protein